jgi:hypothetical protein
MSAGIIIISVTKKIPRAVLSFLVFTHQVNAMAFISNEKLIAAVNSDLSFNITSKK